MLWVIVGGAVLAGIGVAVWANRRPTTFDYRDKRYTRHNDGVFTYADGGSLSDDRERQDVEDYWDSTHSSSDSSDGGGSDGGGDGGGGGGGD